MTIDTEQAVTVTLTITAMDLESALVLMEEAESNIEQGSLAGVIGGEMGQVLFSVDQLDPRSPTLRAPVQTHTTEAIIKDIMDYVNVSLVDENEGEFERFLRERVFGG